MAKRAIDMGETPLCLEILAEAEKAHPSNPSFLYLRALAFAQSYDFSSVRELLRHFIDTEAFTKLAPAMRVDFLSLMGRTFKDEWFETAKDSPAAQTLLKTAFEWYHRAYMESGGDTFPGINAATLATFNGLTEEAKALSERILARCEDILRESRHYWALATRAEALLNLEKKEEAIAAYRETVAIQGVPLRELAATRRQARLLCGILFQDAALLDSVFSLPNVVVFSGHMVDRLDRSIPRFPAVLENEIRSAIVRELESLKAGIIFCSAAAGSDILCLEAADKLGAETHILLSSPRADFRRESVEVCGDQWGGRFDSAIDRATSVRVVNRHHLESNSMAYEYAAQILLGIGELRAKRTGLDVTPLVVWNCEADDGPGGTASFIHHCEGLGLVPCIINTRELAAYPRLGDGGRTKRSPQSRAIAATRIGRMDQDIKAMLFADVVKFSSLQESQLPSFVKQFMGSVSRLIANSDEPPILNNTWGDAVYMVFNSVESCAHFAVSLRDEVRQTDWTKLGLPAALNIRTALHAGPVFNCVDPVTRMVSYTGSHVTYTARMEPITVPGQVFISEAFAALLSVSQSPDFACSYQGQMEMAKGAGKVPIYRLDVKFK